MPERAVRRGATSRPETNLISETPHQDEGDERMTTTPADTQYAATFDDVRAAAARIANQAKRTPVETCRTIDEMAGRRLFFKCEHLQKIGAFKIRGASNAILKLSDEVARRGVVTHSSGNHAQAVALAAKLRGIPATIVMPEGSNRVKRRAVEGYGAKVVECAPTLDAREATAARILAETGATMIPPYDHPDIIAGQGTAAPS
jgi:threonine dehydratase/serine racemase